MGGMMVLVRVAFIVALGWGAWRAHKALSRIEDNTKHVARMNMALIEENVRLSAENAKLRAEVTIWTGKPPE